MTTIHIAAVGDILMWESQVQSAKIGKAGQYTFDSMFQHVAPILKKADLTIGNLETTLSGKQFPYQRRHPKTRYPMFNCPDQLADTLKKIGFDVLTTANNHCMDCGIMGLQRTLDVLDRIGIRHTGTFRTKEDSKKLLVTNVKGIRVGIAAYTYGTNYIPVPKDKKWAVNRIDLPKMEADIGRLRLKSDIVIVAVHFGREFYRYPNERQKEIVKELFAYGADIVLGCHPHVLQPMYFYKKQRRSTKNPHKFVIYSLGNFISEKMLNNQHSTRALILHFKIKKDKKGKISVSKVSYTPTVTNTVKRGGKTVFRILPIDKFLGKTNQKISATYQQKLRLARESIATHMKGNIEPI